MVGFSFFSSGRFQAHWINSQVRPCSIFTAEIFRGSSIGRDRGHLILKYTEQISTLLENGERCLSYLSLSSHCPPYIDHEFLLRDEQNKETEAKIKLKLTISPDLSLPLAEDEAQRAHKILDSLDNTMNHLDGSGPLQVVSGYVDVGQEAMDHAQSAYDAAQSLGSVIHPLGQAIQSLQQIVTAVDSIAGVSTVRDY